MKLGVTIWSQADLTQQTSSSWEHGRIWFYQHGLQSLCTQEPGLGSGPCSGSPQVTVQALLVSRNLFREVLSEGHMLA